MGKFKKNTVNGTRRGSKYPQRVKTAAMCDLLLNDNLSEIAKKHGIPESTLRTWKEKAKLEAETGGLWERARADIIKEITFKAGESARLNLDLIARRLKIGNRNIDRTEEINRLLYDTQTAAAGNEILIVDGRVAAQRVIVPPEIETQLRKEKEDKKPISDFALTNFARTLTSIGRAGAGEDMDGVQKTMKVVLSDDAKELAE